jgi:hypothetical protein
MGIANATLQCLKLHSLSTKENFNFAAKNTNSLAKDWKQRSRARNEGGRGSPRAACCRLGITPEGGERRSTIVQERGVRLDDGGGGMRA